ncbi:hypothetical protein QMK_0698, partial [Clostridioides difficile DA00273]
EKYSSSVVEDYITKNRILRENDLINDLTWCFSR